MKLAIIGKPQSGKTTIFNAASGQQEAVGDFSQASHRAIIKVPDERVDQLAALIAPKKITYAEIEFLDAPGFSGKGKDAGKIEISPDVRLVEALVLVIDAFSPDSNPRTDTQALTDEMMLADMELLDNNIKKKSKKIKVTGDKEEAGIIELLKKCLEFLESERPLIDMELEPSQEKEIRGYKFLTSKPILVVLNISEDDIPRTDEIRREFSDFEQEGKKNVAVVCGKIEAELVAMDEAERQMFLDDLGIETPAVEKLIQRSYSLLGLISFLTSGEPEVRAWTIPAGTIAQKSAGIIHSDIERGFIRAEVTSYADYVEYKTPAALKAAGKTRLEGKEYKVSDGDVILFRFNV